MFYVVLPGVLGGWLGSYFWKWGSEFNSHGIHYYLFYYFKTSTHLRYSDIIEQPEFYDMYHEVFKGRANYADYIRAVNAHYEEASEIVEQWAKASVKAYAIRYTSITLVGSIISTISFFSLLAPFSFAGGVVLYLTARYIKFLFAPVMMKFVCVKMIVDQSLTLYRKERRRFSRKSKK